MSIPAESDARVRRSIPRRRKLAYAAVIIFAGLATIEVICRVLVGTIASPRWAYEQAVVRTIGFPALNSVLEADADAFWRLKADVSDRVIAGHVGGHELLFRLSTDGEGHRRMPVVADAKHTVVFLGDSCTLGIGVNDDETIPALVQKRMAGVRCINAGVPGYTAYQGRVAHGRMAEARRADVVVIAFGFNDEATWDGRSDVDHGRMGSGGGLLDSLGVVRLVRGLVVRAEPQSASPAEVQTIEAGGRSRLNDDEFAGEIRGIIARCREDGSAAVVVAWPLLAQMTQPEDTGKQKVLRRIAESEKVPLVDLVSVFRAKGDKRLFVDVLHASPAGCAVAWDPLESTCRHASLSIL